MEDDARADGDRGLVPERESVYEFDTSANVLGIPPFRQTVPKFSGKRADFAKYRREFINFANGEGLDWVFCSGKRQHTRHRCWRSWTNGRVSG